MNHAFGWKILLLAAGASLLLSGCDLSDKIEANDRADNETIVKIEDDKDVVAPVGQLPEAVVAKRDEILEMLQSGSIRTMVRFVDKEPNFRSNFGGRSHYEHWYLMKRAGLDPMEKTIRIFQEPYGVKDFGAEKYYIWPELATRTSEDLDFSRLTFKERATLQELIGDAGIERLRKGESYPGFRTAIREDGRWVYLLQDN